jgi:hypothetical protein
MRKSVGQAPRAGEQMQQKPCRTSSDIGAEQEIVLSDEVRRRIGNGYYHSPPVESIKTQTIIPELVS